MESRILTPKTEDVLQMLADARRPLISMSWLAILGLGFWLLVCVTMAFGAYGRVAEGSWSTTVAILTWSLVGIPVLLHIWPIIELRRAAKAVAAFATTPSGQAAALSIRVQRNYWRAAAICHLTLIVWIIVAVIALGLVINWENNQPQTLRLLDATR